MQDGVTAPLYQERDDLKSRLTSAEEALARAVQDKENLSEERTQLQYQVKRIDDKLIGKDKCAHDELARIAASWLSRAIA